MQEVDLMNKDEFMIWGRRFNLSVQYDCYENEDILPIQIEALEAFKREADALLSSDQEVKRYCLENHKAEIGDSIDNIFKYVMPDNIYIKRSKEKHIAALMCNYKFDLEHGIALVFENEKLTQIGTQDIIL